MENCRTDMRIPRIWGREVPIRRPKRILDRKRKRCYNIYKQSILKKGNEKMKTITQKIGACIRRGKNRIGAEKIPPLEEMERFGAGGEDVIYRILRENFSCVIRNVVIPHKDKYLEKDFLVMERGVPVVIEVKNWKGTVRIDRSGDFCQDKANGEHKVLKSPVGTTAQYIRCMKEFYGMERTVVGMVVFAEPDCVLDLPPAMEGILLVPAAKMVATVKAQVRLYAKEPERLPPESVLRTTRFYSRDSEFCKGLLADDAIACKDSAGNDVLLNPECLRAVRLEPQPFRLRDKMTVIYTNGATDVFYNQDTVVTVCCLDGKAKKIALNRIRYILF